MSTGSDAGTKSSLTKQSMMNMMAGTFLAAMISASGYAVHLLHSVDSNNKTTQATVMNIEKSVDGLQGTLNKLMPRDLADSTHTDIYRHLGGMQADIAKLEQTCIRGR